MLKFLMKPAAHRLPKPHENSRQKKHVFCWRWLPQGSASRKGLKVALVTVDKPIICTWSIMDINGNSRIRLIGGIYHTYKAYFSGLCKGISAQHMALNRTVPPFKDPGIPADNMKPYR